MGILTDDMKRLIDEQKLAFHATVCPDGSPNLSPKGSTRVWDDDHLFFADICPAFYDLYSRDDVMRWLGSHPRRTLATLDEARERLDRGQRAPRSGL